jgi:hypothetical protein
MESQDDFEAYLMFMDDTIVQLFDYLPEEVAQQLDFTPESLVPLEKWLLGKYDSSKAILQPSENWALDRVAKYVGQTIRKTAGGEWHIELENPNYAYYRLPEIRNGRGGTECPVTLVTAAMDRRRGDFMKTIVQNMTREEW